MRHLKSLGLLLLLCTSASDAQTIQPVFIYNGPTKLGSVGNLKFTGAGVACAPPSGGFITCTIVGDSGTVNAISPISGDGSLGSPLSCPTCTTATPSAIGDMLYSTSGTRAMSVLADVSVGSYMRSGGVAAAPLWSTLKLPNSATSGDLFYATSSNTMGSLAILGSSGMFLKSTGLAPNWSLIAESDVTNLVSDLGAKFPLAGDSTGVVVLNMPGATSAQQINLGKYFAIGVLLPSTYYYDGWVAPNNSGSKYWLIESATGGHALEMGFNQSGVGTINTPYGNICQSSTCLTVQTWGCDDGAYNTEWIHYGHGADASFIYGYVNGILCGQTSWNGTRQTYNVSTSSTGQLLIGGSDHNNFNGHIGGYVRGWEDFSPFSSPSLAFRPERFPSTRAFDFVNKFTPANLLIDLTSPQTAIFHDASPIGYSGYKKIATPSAPTITPQGTTGATTYTYRIAALLGDLSTPVSSSGSTNTGNATLNGTDFNRITWTSTDPRVTAYTIWRNSGGATQGQIGTVPANALTFDDTGIAAVVTNQPTANTTTGGQLHSGFIWGATAGTGGVDDGLPQNPQITYPTPQWVYDSTAPFTRTTAPPAQTAFVPSPSPVPVGAKIYDDFERADQTYAFQQSPTLGSTVAGASLGSLAWTCERRSGDGGGTGAWGILHGIARFLDSVQSQCFVTNNSATMDVRISRRIGTYNTISHTQTGVVFRRVDTNNFWVAYVYGTLGSATVRFSRVVGGTQTALQDYSLAGGGTSWTRLRITASGDTLTAYRGVASGAFDANGAPLYTWTQAGQFTDSTHNTGVGVGLAMASTSGNLAVTSLATFKNIEVQ